MKNFSVKNRLALHTKQGFTLIELLVVISIIALLLSILMPSLSRVKQQARTVVCGVNAKQFGTIIALYQAGNNDEVPIILNWSANFRNPDLPAAYLLPSLALRDYVENKLPPELDPLQGWSQSDPRWAEYFENYIPKFFVCPLTRGKSTGGLAWSGPDPIDIGGVSMEGWRCKGKFESFTTYWLPDPLRRSRGFNIYRNVSGNGDHPLGLPHGTLEYGGLKWYNDSGLNLRQGETVDNNPEKLRPTKWKRSDLNRVKTGSLGEAVISFCKMGETWHGSGGSGSPAAIYNYGNHAKGSQGGTNALMGDGHVTWVAGDRIGWD